MATKGGGKRPGSKGGGEGDLLDLARSILAMAGTEIDARRAAVDDVADKARSTVRRAQEGASTEDRVVLDQAYERLDADREHVRGEAETKLQVIDDLAHDLAALASRVRGQMPS